MSIKQKPLSEITEEDLWDLVHDKVIENKNIDYKKDVPGNADKDKKEFLADVSSFANAGGGDIIFGISEKSEDGLNTGFPEDVCGVTVNLDSLKLKLESSIRDGISPRIIGCQFQIVPLSSGTNVLIIRIPYSYQGPHAVTFSGTFRFYSRNSSGKYPLDVGELKSAFLNQSNIGDSIRQYNLERTSKIIAGETPCQLRKPPLIIVHFNPLDREENIDIVSLERSYTDHKLIYYTTGNWRFNIDGLLVQSINKDGVYLAYTQVFRNGIVEGVTEMPSVHTSGTIAIYAIQNKLIDFIKHYLSVIEKYGKSYPIQVSIKFYGMKELNINLTRFDEMDGDHSFDRDLIVLPDVLINDDDDRPMPIKLRPCFDALWQAAGWPGAKNYDAEGNWTSEPR
ncbi:ATP-binding protein [bacterium]|nr:ATP-binding protein [bacterium]